MNGCAQLACSDEIEEGELSRDSGNLEDQPFNSGSAYNIPDSKTNPLIDRHGQAQAIPPEEEFEFQKVSQRQYQDHLYPLKDRRPYRRNEPRIKHQKPLNVPQPIYKPDPPVYPHPIYPMMPVPFYREPMPHPIVYDPHYMHYQPYSHHPYPMPYIQSIAQPLPQEPPVQRVKSLKVMCVESIKTKISDILKNSRKNDLEAVLLMTKKALYWEKLSATGNDEALSQFETTMFDLLEVLDHNNSKFGLLSAILDQLKSHDLINRLKKVRNHWERETPKQVSQIQLKLDVLFEKSGKLIR